MSKTFMTIGECMVEIAPEPDGRFRMGFAGDTLNTAWYARKVASDEIEVKFLSAVGDDDASRQMTEFIQDAGVTPVLGQYDGRSVGLYVISLKDGERSFSYWRSASAARRLAEDLSGLDGLAKGDMALFTGITLGILPDEGREALFAACTKARSRGVTIAFDPNLRPRLWHDTEEMRHWVIRGAKVADIALPSFDDEQSYFGDEDQQATSQRYLDCGAELVIVKDGGNPVIVATREDTINVPVDPLQHIVDSTAAGDSFNAQFLISVMLGEAAHEAAAKGARLAAKVIGASGALVEI